MINLRNKKSVVFWPSLVIFTAILFILFFYFAIAPKAYTVENFGKLTNITNGIVKRDIFTNEYFNDIGSIFSKKTYFRSNNGLIDYNIINRYLNIYYLNSNPNSRDQPKVGKELNKDYINKIKSLDCNYGTYNNVWINELSNVNCSDIITSTYLKYLYLTEYKNYVQNYKDLFGFYNFNFNYKIYFVNNNITLEAQKSFYKNLFVNFNGNKNANNEFITFNSTIHKYSIDYNNYFNFVTQVKRDLQSSLKNFYINLSDCISNVMQSNPKIEEPTNYCINKILKKDMLVNLTKFYKNVNLNIISQIIKEQKDSKRYFLININYNFKDVKNLQSNNKLLNFNILLEDRVPPKPIMFSLENTELSKDSITIKILKPNDLSTINRFIVIYSLSNFTSDKSLENAIMNGEIPSGNKKKSLTTCLSESGKSIKYYKSDTADNGKGEQLSFYILSSNKIRFKPDSEGKNYAYMILDKYCNNGKLENFPDSKNVFIGVYAVNKEGDLYRMPLKSMVKVITTKDLEGPVPPIFISFGNTNSFTTTSFASLSLLIKLYKLGKLPTIKSTGNIGGLSNSFAFIVGNYTPSGEVYGYYLLVSSNPTFDYKECINGNENNCYFTFLPKSNNMKFLVTSNDNLLSSNIPKIKILNTDIKDFSLISTYHFNKQFKLENGETYYFILIAVNKNKYGYFSNSYILKDGSNSYYFSQNPKQVSIVDNQPPDYLKSIVLPQKIELDKQTDNLILNYKVNTGYKVSGLILSGKVIEKNNIVKNFKGVIGSSKVLVTEGISIPNEIRSGNVIEVDLNKIIPYYGVSSNNYENVYGDNFNFYSMKWVNPELQNSKSS